MRENDLPGFSKDDIEFLENYSRMVVADLDYYKIYNYVSKFEEEKLDVGDMITRDRYPPNKRAAAELVIKRRMYAYAEAVDSEVPAGAMRSFAGGYIVIESAKSLLNDFGTYWLFEPTVEKILELNEDETTRAVDFITEFKHSEQGDVLFQSADSLHAKLSEWTVDDETTENIKKGLELFQQAQGVLEVGFLHLLALKRILDGETPTLDDFEYIRTSDVRRELTDTENHPNSVYFDLIVNQYDSRLRNAIVHGDLIHDPVNSQLKIPSKNQTISYEKFNQIAKRTFSITLFVSGMYSALVEWRLVLIRDADEFSRDDLPL